MTCKLSIVMPVFGHKDTTMATLKNLREVLYQYQKNKTCEIIVIDDGSTDGTVEYLKKQNDIIFIDNKINKGVTYSWNTGVEKAKGEYICVINNDVEFPYGFFDKLMGGFINDNIAFTVPRRTSGRKGKDIIRYYVNHLCGFCYMFRKEDKHTFFPIDKRLRTFGNDNRLYYRAKEYGMKVNTIYDAICHHQESLTARLIDNIDIDTFDTICREEGWNLLPVTHPAICIKQNILI